MQLNSTRRNRSADSLAGPMIDFIQQKKRSNIAPSFAKKLSRSTEDNTIRERMTVIPYVSILLNVIFVRFTDILRVLQISKEQFVVCLLTICYALHPTQICDARSALYYLDSGQNRRKLVSPWKLTIFVMWVLLERSLWELLSLS